MKKAIEAIGEQRHENEIIKLISKEQINLIFLFLSGLLIVNLVFAFYRFIILNEIRKFYYQLKSAFFLRSKKIINDKAWLLFLIPGIFSIYLAISFPVTYDEAYTYLNYSSRGFVSSIGYYITPNNHILNSLLAYFMLFVPIKNELLLIRIPSVFFNLIILFFSYTLMNEYFNKRFALVYVSILSILFYSVYYSYQCRGYCLLDFCFLIMMYSIFKILNENKIFYWWIFIISSILGFYVMPSFLYPFLTSIFIIILFLKKISIRLIFSTLIIVTIVGILYTPIILINGLNALVNNRFVQPIERVEVLKKLPLFLITALKEITGVHFYIVLGIIILGIIIMIKEKLKPALIISIVFLLSPIILLISHSVIPFSRTFVYYVFIFAFFGTFLVDKLIKNFNLNILFLICISIQFFSLINFQFINNQIESYSIQADKDIFKIIEGKKYLVNNWTFDPFLLFYLKTEKKKFNIDYIPEMPLNVDTFNKKFDYIIIDTKFDRTLLKKPYINYSRYHIYKY